MNVSRLRRKMREVEKQFGRKVELTGISRGTIASIEVDDIVIGTLDLGGNLDQGNGDIIFNSNAARFILPGKEIYGYPR